MSGQTADLLIAAAAFQTALANSSPNAIRAAISGAMLAHAAADTVYDRRMWNATLAALKTAAPSGTFEGCFGTQC